MFGDDDMNFDHKLETFGVDLNALKQSPMSRIFRAWIEDWEKDFLQNNDCVAEERILEKYKNLVFYDPNTK